MANKIRITPAELTAQAAKIREASSKTQEIHSKSNQAMNAISNAMSGKFKSNMDKKGKKLLKNLTELKNSLNQGATVAENCAKSYENMDKELRKQIGDSLPQEVVNTPASNQQVMTEFQMKVEEMKQKEGFRQGDYWGNNSHYQGQYNGYYINAWSCCAKAKQMQIEVTGKLGARTGITDASQIQVGDVIHYYYPGTYWFQGKEYPNEHWVFVTAVNGNTISVGEGNAWDGKNSERVNYRDMDISEFNNMESIYR